MYCPASAMPTTFDILQTQLKAVPAPSTIGILVIEDGGVTIIYVALAKWRITAGIVLIQAVLDCKMSN